MKECCRMRWHVRPLSVGICPSKSEIVTALHSRENCAVLKKKSAQLQKRLEASRENECLDTFIVGRRIVGVDCLM